MHKRGTSIAELLLALVIIALLGAISYKKLSDLAMEYRLRSAVDKVQSDIIQMKTYSIMKENLWGIRLEPGRSCYVIFEDRDRNCRLGNGSVGDQNCIYNNVQVYPNCHDPTIDCILIVKLPNGIQSSLDRSIVFDKKGYPRNAICGLGMNTVRLVNLRGRKGDVIVDRYGRIRIVYQ